MRGKKATSVGGVPAKWH